MSSARKILVLCLGNSDRADDGIGPAVAARLDSLLPVGTVLAVRSGDMLAAIEEWQGFDAMICVDAAAPNERPGTIHRFELGNDGLPRSATRVSSHAFGLAEVISLARALGLAPPEMVVFAIEGAQFDAGAPMSPEVMRAVATVAEQVADEATSLLEVTSHA